MTHRLAHHAVHAGIRITIALRDSGKPSKFHEGRVEVNHFFRSVRQIHQCILGKTSSVDQGQPGCRTRLQEYGTVWILRLGTIPQLCASKRDPASVRTN